MRIPVAFFFLVSLALPTSAGAANDLDALFEGHRYAMSFDGTSMTGEGAEWLIGEARKAQYVLFGEQHATADIAELCTALYRAAGDFDATVVEVGRWSTPKMEALLRAGELAAYLKANGGLTFPFFFFAEEVDFAKAAIAGKPAGTLWGVDQEFIAAGAVVLELLKGMATTEAQRTAVAHALSGVPENPMMLGAGDEGPWRAIESAFASGGDEAQRLIREVFLSREIYAPFTGGGGSVYVANEKRENYMKRNLDRHVEQLRRTGNADPRLFFKFGANHVSYGRSPTHVISLGTYVHEAGLSRARRTMNVAVDCQGGEMLDPRSGKPVPCKSYFLGEDSGLARYLHKDQITVLDLKSVRPKRKLWKEFDERSRRLIWAFDVYVAMPNPKPASLVVGP